MSETNREMALKWFEEVWNKGRREVIAQMLTPNTVIHDGPSISRGPEGFYPFFDLLHSAFSDISLEAVQSIAERDLVCVQWVSTSKHTGEGLGVAPSGKTITVTGISIIRFADGKMAEAWQNWDMHGMLAQVKANKPIYLGMSA